MAEPHRLAHTESPFTLFSKSYELVKQNLNIFILIYSVSGLFALWNFLSWFSDDNRAADSGNGAFSSVFSSFSGLHYSSPNGLSIGLVFLLGILALGFGLMQTILTLRVAQGKKPTFGSIWEEFKKKGLKLLGLEIMMGIGIIIGLILLIVPGIILIWRWFLAPYILIDKNTTISEALVQSWEITKGYAWPVYAVILVGILWGLVGAVPLVGVIASFLLGVAYSCAPALRYLELKRS